MDVFVVDASVALAWCFTDESTEWTQGLLERLRAGGRIIAPSHWALEVANALCTAVRRKRIKPDQPQLLWDQLASLPIEIQSPLDSIQMKVVLVLSEKFGLTAYDAAHLELALRGQLPLATLDEDLRKAAEAEGLPLL
jgi:predicted nucleic acid-binding protein